MMKTLFKRLSDILGYLRRPNRNNLLKKYMTWFFVIIFIPISIIFTVSILYTVTFQNFQTEVATTKALTAAENIIATTLDFVENQSYSILSNSQVNAAIFSNDIPGDAEAFKYSKELMMTSLELNNSLHSASVYSFYNNYLFGTNTGTFLDNARLRDIPWYTYYKETGLTDFFIPIKSNSAEYLCLVRSLKSSGTLSAFSIVYIDADLLFSFANQENYILVSNKGERIFYTTSSALSRGSKEDLDVYLKALSKTGSTMDISFDKVVAGTYIPYSNINLIMFMDNPAKIHLIIVISVSVLILLLLMVFALYLSGYLTDVFYSHIAKTISYLTSDTGTSYDDTQDEMFWIQNSIYSIIDSNKDLELELSKSIIQLKNSQLAAMQLQCNPHFLFNALNLANMHTMSNSGEENTASEIIVLVSDLLRIALDTEHYFTSIEEEIVFSLKYIKLQSLKYANSFDAEFDVDNSILKNETVKLTMQPLIENAFKHGICKLGNSKRGKLKISIRPDGNNIIFRIKDNGNTDAQALSDVNDALNRDLYTIVKKNIGLKNTNSRIKILFGAQYGCKIYREGDWTVAEMVIPQKTKKGEKQ